jgi:hypothetical protein
MTLRVRTLTILVPLLCVAEAAFGQVGHTKITRWPQGRRAAVSITYDVARYMRERMHGTARSYVRGDAISVVLRDDLTDERYDLSLTLETQVPPDWTAVDARQGRRAQRVPVVRQDGRSYVLYAAIPNGEDVQLTRTAPQSPSTMACQ